jgi:hypothetical protein
MTRVATVELSSAVRREGSRTGRTPARCVGQPARPVPLGRRRLRSWAGRLVPMALSLFVSSGAAAHDYPTVDRVEYVHVCMRDNPGPSQEMVYKCSCLIDAIAKRMSYDEFVDGSTAVNAYTIGGERGETMRSYAHAKTLADRFREVQAAAKKSCFIR